MSGENREARLFLALKVPSEIKDGLSRFQQKLKRGLGEAEIPFRWVPEDCFHITLFFLGATTPERQQSLREPMAEIARGVKDFSLEIRGIGAFPEDRAARVVWAGVQRSRELVSLQQEVESAVIPLGWRPEDRDFHPHLTLARLRNTQSVRTYIDPFRRQDFGSFTAREIALFQSVPRIPYPEYRVIESFPFGE